MRVSRKFSWLAVAFLAASILLPLALPSEQAKAAPPGFVYRVGTQLFLNGQPFRFAGPNIVWLGLDEVAGQDAGFQQVDYPSQFRVNDGLDTVVAMGGTVIRSHTLGHSFGCATNAGILYGQTYHGRCLEPALGQFNEEAFRHVDYAIYAAGQRGLKLILPLVDEYQYFHGGRYTFTTWRGVPASDFWTNPVVISDFKAYLNKIINRVNIYNNIRYKDDPTIMAWETGNELNGPTSWTQEIAHYIRTQDTNHLIIDGTYGINDNSLSIPYVDIYSDHFYPLRISKLQSDAAKVSAANKVFYIGEFPWQNNPNDGAADTLPNFLSAVESSSAVGTSYWILFPHRGNYHYMQHDDGGISYTLHWPGDNTAMRTAAQQLRTHAYNMRGIPVPAHAVPSAPLITNISGNTIYWRGAVGGDKYSVESSTTGATGTWTVVCNKCGSDNPGFWSDPTTYSGTVWYRVRAWNLGDVAGPYSPVQQKGVSIPPATATSWPVVQPSPTFGPSTATFTPTPLPPTPTRTPQPAGTFYKGININGNAVTIEGNLWLSDAQALAQGFTIGASANRDTKSLTPNPATDSQTAHMLNSLVYTFTDLNFTQTIPNGSYQVYLWTMENYQSQIRSWNAVMEGVTVGRNLGILNMNQWAKYGPFNTTVNDGMLNIDLIHVNANPMLMGLAIYSTGSVPTDTPCASCPTNTPQPPTPTRSNTPIPPTGTRTNTPLPPTASNTPLPPTGTSTPVPPIPGTFVKGINFNGNAVTIDGKSWLSYSAALSQGLTVSGGNPDTKTLTPIPAVDADTSHMLNTLLYSATDPGNINLSQTITNGSYQIYVWTMENWQSNSRRWNLRVEGTQVATDLGLMPLNEWRRYGPYNAAVTDGVLNVDLIGVQGRSMIMGLAIYTQGTVPTNTPGGATATRTATRTNTPALPTNTPSGPTATRTNTPIPPTATRTPTRTNTPAASNTPVSSSLKIQSRANEASANPTSIQPFFRIHNTGSASVPMSELKIRYYFTKDNTRPILWNCIWAQPGCGTVSGTVVAMGTPKTNADTYLELSFTTAAGSIAAGGNSGELQNYMKHDDWSAFTQTNDFSFNSSNPYIDWNKVTLYRNGTLVWGTEP